MTAEREDAGHGPGQLLPGSGRAAIDLAEDLGERIGYSLGTLYRRARGFTETAAPEPDQSDATVSERAEALVDQAEQQLNLYGAMVWDGMRRIAARAMEEYQDIAAEAQALRQGQQPPHEERQRDSGQ